MSVLVDTCIWSLVLRRNKLTHAHIAKELEELISETRAKIIGPIRQEILSGIKNPKQFSTLAKHLQAFEDIPIIKDDYIQAADFFNLLQSKGIQGSNTDFLICAVTIRCQIPIYTVDKDFAFFSKHIPIYLHEKQ